MKEKFQSLLQRSQPVIKFFTNNRFLKRARITYGVLWNLLLIFIIFAVLGTAFAGGVGAGYFASLVKEEPIRPYDNMKKDIYNYEETSQLYFSNDVYLGKMRTDLEREEVSIDEVSDHLVNALIATEDEYFKEHNGVVPKAILRAIVQEFTNSASQTGGSTLTQQLIKNQILTNEVSFDRKAKEILLAMRLERFFEKEEILEAYLNVATLGRNSSGRNIAGVKSAAKGIFGVEPKDLSLPQAAFIAGLPQAPFSYTPFTNGGEVKENLEPGIARMQTVLYRMFEEGYITEEEYDTAVNHDIAKDFIGPLPSVNDNYPWLTVELESRAKDIISVILAEQEGYSKDDLDNNDELFEKYTTLADREMRQRGYQIHSTINKEIYDSMQKTKDAYEMYGQELTRTKIDPETGEEVEVPNPVQVGAIMIENKTGKIISFVGGRDFDLEQSNHATYTIRQNGSTMKPLLVYAPALEFGEIGAGSPLPDVDMTIMGGNGVPWNPQNYSFDYNGLIPARYALAESLNIPAARLYTRIFNKQPIQFLEKMGFSTLTNREKENYSLSLGGMERGVTLEENTNAYTTFANGGKFVDAYMIDKIVDKDGNTIFQHEGESVDVFSPETAYMTIDMMRDTFDHYAGTGRYAKTFLNFSSDWAGKSGTTQDYKDHWFIGSNPNITFGTWLGYDDPQSMYRAMETYGHYGLRNIRLWSYLLNDAHDLAPDLIDPEGAFQEPEGIVTRSFCGISGLAPSEACSQAGLVRSDLFNAQYAPSKTDDSLLKSRYVMANGKKYLALDSTPEEFSQPGVILNPDFVESILNGINADPRQLIPADDEKYKNILVAENKIEDDGAAPGTVNATASGNKITWTASASSDVVGYRVFTVSGQKVASVKSDSDLVTSVGNGEYYVVAVDVAGKQSGKSNTVRIGQEKEEPKPPKEEKPKPEKPEEPKPEPGNTGGGNSGDEGGGSDSGNEGGGSDSGSDSGDSSGSDSGGNESSTQG
ncbi:penicillin-binding protein [Rossellomorea vietnamensis]|uniref:Penicillin-binding protein n=1 Tax=Rossellomorea vietnamensis TaxID=218284 RepID=A0A5D4P1T9_9BACI|nr:transglycosylase domain-containing protein [Rossellomorea vietnamensis]TYS19778.1 penicillin-binding protein [Rossellomorea vietnamensis]